MTEPHTADLSTRARYRQEGAEHERERIIRLLEQAKSVFMVDTVSCGIMTSLIALIKERE